MPHFTFQPPALRLRHIYAYLISASGHVLDKDNLFLTYKGRDRTPIGPEWHSDVAGGVEIANTFIPRHPLLTRTIPFYPFVWKNYYLEREGKYTIRRKIYWDTLTRNHLTAVTFNWMTGQWTAIIDVYKVHTTHLPVQTFRSPQIPNSFQLNNSDILPSNQDPHSKTWHQRSSPPIGLCST